MTSAAEETKIGAEDDLAGEETPAVKHEYIAGEVFAKAEAGEAHVTVALNLASLDFSCPLDSVYEDIEFD
jgi:hypothetical protein